ncbi:GNAT family N-acetyltransferase [Acidithiobacillus ferrooxidans]|uniref:GNAT family N-acetyltransferase n=1 Tax=Acidithiobacillus ferrooxidans TaxID=920 RepID=UPI001C06C932|nr:GNAT family N-acetyltransferase [Acidithiobacillus ferrooxidans]MBU2856799.1 GNAT family N-acetyltransferase [Acidithiobacillus ferrooxidans]
MKSIIFSHISDVPEEAWDALNAQGSVTMSRAFWSVVEQSDLNDFTYSHVLFLEEDDTPAGIVSFYSVTTDIAIFAPKAIRSLLNVVRSVWPGFLKLKMLECGTPVTITSPPFVSASSRERLLASIMDMLLQTARREGHLLIILRDFEPNAQELRRPLQKRGYHWIESLPNTYMNILWDSAEAYRQSMRSYYRSKLQKHLKRNTEAGVHHKLVDDFADMADILCRQWMVVHTHAKEFQREVLTPEFYRALSQEMGSDSKVLLFYKNEELVGHALLLMDGEMLRWLYVGREAAVNDSLYIYIAYTVVESAILLGARQLEMGLTTYPIKQDLGADVVPIQMALRATWSWVNPFVGLGYRLLNHIPETHLRPIFKTKK